MVHIATAIYNVGLLTVMAWLIISTQSALPLFLLLLLFAFVRKDDDN